MEVLGYLLPPQNCPHANSRRMNHPPANLEDLGWYRPESAGDDKMRDGRDSGDKMDSGKGAKARALGILRESWVTKAVSTTHDSDLGTLAQGSF